MDGIDGKELREKGAKWLERIRTAKKRESDWRASARNAEGIYTLSKSGNKQYQFNILFSNVETIVPAIYNSTPVPDVRPRWSRDNTVLRDVAEVTERVITAMIDDGNLDAEVEQAAKSVYLTGRGLVRVRFEADSRTEESVDEFGQPVEVEIIENERTVFEVVPWADFVFGEAKRWDLVPWVAFRHIIEGDDDFDKPLLDAQRDPSDEESSGDDEVWEVWCKKSGMVYFVRQRDSSIVKMTQDPMGLPGFFPVAKPVQPLTVAGRLTPVCPFDVYRDLADELDQTTRRINAILKGLKVRGGVIGAAADIKAMADADDNQLVPIQNVEGLAATGGLDKAIVWWPIEQAVSVLQHLYVFRDQVKQAIYEITGISDIVRGASKVETATAQQIKTQWGSLRIKDMQKEIAGMVRDLFVMSAHVIFNQFTVSTLKEISGMEITEEMEAVFQSGLRQYRIDVESDSTVRADLTRERGEMSEFLQGTAHFFGVIAPIVQGMPQIAEPVAALYAAHARQFNLGKQAEDALDRMIEMAKGMQGQQGGQPDPAAQQQQMGDAAKYLAEQGRLKIQEAEVQRKMAKDLSDRQLAEARLYFDREKAGAELEIEKNQRRAALIGDT